MGYVLQRRGALIAACGLAWLALCSAPAAADEPPGYKAETWRIDGGLTFSRFEQQVKTEIGGQAGERLVEETQFGITLFATYRVWGPFALGLYAQYDVGVRSAAHFDGFAADGAATVKNETGGTYHEVWLGPLLRVQWRSLFAEVAYGALGLRKDDARSDIGGDGDAALLTSPSVAWFVALGGGIPIIDSLELVLRLEYRVRYYDRRTNGDLEGGLAHGTQNFTPFMGVAWKIY